MVGPSLRYLDCYCDDLDGVELDYITYKWCR